MNRTILVVLFLLALAAQPLTAGVACDDLGVGISAGMLQPSGGDEEFEDSGFLLGLSVSRPLTENVWIALEYTRAETRNGEDLPEEETSEEPGTRFSSWGEPDEFRTIWNRAGLSALYYFTPDAKVRPFVSAGLGMTFWEVQDWRDDADETGGIPQGYNDDGKPATLSGTELTASLGIGADLFMTERFAVTLAGRYHFLLDANIDNVGFSAARGADFVDVNNSMLEASVGLAYYFGPADCDGDGIYGSKDKCSRKPEDFDGFEDDDGCPDPDNDGDGILDIDDECPDDAEDFDGDEDEDGCPDIDSDGDGVYDMFDKCPDTPLGTKVDKVGCPIVVKPVKPAAPVPPVVPVPGPVVAHFPLGEAVLDASAMADLDALAKGLEAHPDLKVAIEGHTCDIDTDAFNQRLSERRANTVRDYLASVGVDPARMTTTGYGETRPEVPNDSDEHRMQNRRAVVTPR